MQAQAGGGLQVPAELAVDAGLRLAKARLWHHPVVRRKMRRPVVQATAKLGAGGQRVERPLVDVQLVAVGELRAEETQPVARSEAMTLVAVDLVAMEPLQLVGHPR